MAILRNKRKITALKKKNHEKPRRGNLAQKTKVSILQEEFITQVSEEIEVSITKKPSKVFSRTKSCLLGALSQLDKFLLDPLNQGHSESAPETFWNRHGENHRTNEQSSQTDPLLKRGSSRASLHKILAQTMPTALALKSD